MLSDPQERAWYDNHREEILRGARGEKLDEDGLDVFQYFTSSCYSGFGDDDKGFYAVYTEVFNTLAAEDSEFMDGSDDEEDIPSFGKSDDDYETVVGPFYAYWSVYSTHRSYSWLDKYDTRQGENRWVKRKMEQENKKIRDKMSCITVPTLHIFGTGDKYLGLDTAQASSKYVMNYQLDLLEGVSHWSIEEAPEQVNKQMEKFLQQ